MVSIYWHEIPLIRICLPFIAGILIQQTWMNHWPLIIGGGLMFGCSLATILSSLTHVRQLLRTVTICFLMFSVGAFIRFVAEPDLSNFDVKHELIVARVCTAEQTDYGCRAKLRLLDQTHRHSDIIAFVRDSGIELRPRDTVILARNAELIDPPSNPFAFDFKEYYAKQGIHLRVFVGPDDIIAHRPFKGASLVRTCTILRERLCKVLDEHIDNPRSKGVLKAMTVGIRSGLDDEVYDAYAKSGAIHILAISGLHVGIVSFILFFLFGRTKPVDSVWMKLLRTVALLLGIWTFAAIAGMSPSVTRAAFMFSLYLGAINLKRQVQGLNILACAALIFLSIDPFQINSLSFQFSYLALAGILIFGKPIYRLLALNNPLFKFAWGTIVLAISAQLFLIPLMIHYFHQVSLISVLSGIIAIPAAYLVVCGGLLLFAFHWISEGLAGFIGQALDSGIELLNRAMEWMSLLPMSHLSDLYVHGVILALMFIIAAFVALRLLTKMILWTYACVAVAFLALTMQLFLYQASSDRMFVAVYPVGNTIHIDYIQDGICTSYGSDTDIPKYQLNEINTFRYVSGAGQTLEHRSQGEVTSIDLPGASDDGFQEPFRIVYISKDIQPSLPAPDCIVVGKDVSGYARRSIEAFCIENCITFHDLKKQGSLYLTQITKPQSNEKSWQYLKG